MYTFSLLKNFWIEEEYSRDVVNRIINEHKTSYIIARLLYLVPNLEFDDVPDFLNPKMKNLMPNPNHLLEMPKAVERIHTAIEKKENNKGNAHNVEKVKFYKRTIEEELTRIC
jgi:hypothetical protein